MGIQRDDEWNTLLEIFIGESFEMLEEIEPKLIDLERVTDEAAVAPAINAIFRVFHSFKGGAAALQLNVIRDVTHAAESLLEFIRAKKVAICPPLIDVLCETGDFVKLMLEVVKRDLDDQGLLADSEGVIERIKKAQQGVYDGTSTRRASPPAVPPASPQAGKPQAGEPQAGKPPAIPDSLAELKLEITAEMVDRFAEEADELLEEAEHSLLGFEKEPNEDKIQHAFRSIHSLKGNCGFFGFHDLERLSHAIESVLSKVRDQVLVMDRPIMSCLLEHLDILKKTVKGLRQTRTDRIENVEVMVKKLHEAASGTGPGMPAAPRIGELLVNQGMITPEALEETLQLQHALTGGDAEGADHGKPKVAHADTQQRQAIRVNTDKLDQLVELVGELVISQANVSHNPELQGLKLDRFQKEMDRLSKIIKDLQRIAMAIRMIPVAGLFRKMARPLRDLAGSLGKKIEFFCVGEETEVDKNVIELLGDPLMHVIRNAADHGVEVPAERVKAGKPEAGKIVLEARHSGGEVLIIVSDDGQGLDRERILAKAIRQEMCPTDGSGLSDDDVFQFIFEPGFSTAEKVTEVSGRGVGMDVVKRNIERLKGRVEIRSQPGQGAQFIFHIPLTLAIIDGMVVRVGRDRFVFPIQNILEFFKPTSDEITSLTGGGEGVMLRNTFIPLVRVGGIFNMPQGDGRLSQGHVMVVEYENQRIGLLVDEILGQQQTVIKSLGAAFGSMPGISGAAVMPDGNVGLILDPAGLIKLAGMVR